MFEIPVQLLMAQFFQQAAEMEGLEVDRDLLRARLADGYRDAEREPLEPARFDELVADLTPEDLQRMALAVTALDLSPVRDGLRASPAPALAFVTISRQLPLFTLSLLRQSVLRCEEFARRLVLSLEWTVEDESAEESRERLERIDYARLCSQAERARMSAQERVEYLQKLQDEQEQSLARRGKW